MVDALAVTILSFHSYEYCRKYHSMPPWKGHRRMLGLAEPGFGAVADLYALSKL